MALIDRATMLVDADADAMSYSPFDVPSADIETLVGHNSGLFEYSVSNIVRKWYAQVVKWHLFSYIRLHPVIVVFGPIKVNIPQYFLDLALYFCDK